MLWNDKQKKSQRHAANGQALVEYAMILAIVAVLFAFTLAATGPAIGNVFSTAVYNLIGGRPEDVVRLNNPDGGMGLSDSFWATVEWVKKNPPPEAPSSRNEPLPPADPPTPGPSPTPSPVTPSRTPMPTGTMQPSETPADKRHVAPWLDKIENPDWYRIDNAVWLGLDEWHGSYYANPTLNGNPAWEEWHGNLGIDKFSIDFNWPGNSGPRENWTGDNFSVRWTRQIYVEGPDPVTVRFTSTAGGDNTGVRLYVYERDAGVDGSNCGGVASGGNPTGAATTYDNGCLLIDNWSRNGGTHSVDRTLNPGFYIVQLDYFHENGNSQVKLDMQSTTNRHQEDDTVPSGGTPQCNWYRAETERSNSSAFMWEENRDGDFPANQICYLELRGFIDFANLAPSTSPQMVFWDAWDMASANTEVWLEIAEYAPIAEDRVWQRIDLRQGTTNYNWTRNVIDLTPYVNLYDNKEFTFRFAMRDNGGAAPRRWYVDDIEIRNLQTKTFSVCTGNKDNCGSYWNLDNAAAFSGNAGDANQPPDFITTGRWSLTNERAQGLLSWDSGPIVRNSESGNNQADRNRVRINTLEFNGWIDLQTNVPDADGDEGAPMLSFYHAYHFGTGTQLELQYTRDPYDTTPDNWQTVEVLVAEPSSTVSEPNLIMREVSLTGIPNWDTQPFRLRFAQIVESNAANGNGWWIDNIYIERLGVPRFSDYPFFDSAEGGVGNWLPEGQWGITGDENYTRDQCQGCGRSFTDSPNGNYLHGSNASLQLRYPIDLNFNTPENLDPADESNIQTAAASRPVLSFFHKRSLANADNLYVEWSNDEGLTWNVVWQYVFDSSTRRQLAWEYIEVELTAIQNLSNPADPYSDDILLRFRLDARTNGSVSDGVYLDDIRIENFAENNYKLWDGEYNHPTYGRGDFTSFAEDFDSPADYWNRWILGDWGSNTWEQHSGLTAVTESPPNNNGNTVNTRQNTFSVMTLDRVIDMRAVETTDNPTLYFWTNYYLGPNDVISVQVAQENPGYNPIDSNGLWTAGPNYQRTLGWGEWQTIWYREDQARNEAWTRQAVNLNSFAGERIKVRFVYNKMNSNSRRDGWNVDDVVIQYRSTIPEPLPFLDSARSMGNWIAEGTWGLAPDQWRGSGGGPADMGNEFWHGVYYDCERHTEVTGGGQCNNANQFNQLLYTNYNTRTERPYDPSRDIEEYVLEINHDFGSNGRPIGGVNDPTWNDYYAARWKRQITISVPQASVTFISISDDGVRLRYTGPGVNGNNWNIIENWSYHGRTIDMRTINFNQGTYNLILEWFEASGDAVVILSAGINNFSFTDSPKAGNTPSFPEIKTIAYSSSSLMLRRPILLTGATRPVIQYYTRYQMNQSTGRFEVSANGGFDWTQAGLTASTNGFSCPPSPGVPGSTYNENGSGMQAVTCNPTVTGHFWPMSNGQPEPSFWQMRQHNLSNYINDGLINIRFRIDAPYDQWQLDDGWYITDIEIMP